jgi:butyryl-CoA dehydrogenase
VTAHVVDVADRDAVEAWAAAVVAEHGAVHIVVNNAGVALGADVEHMDYADLQWLMGVNFWGVVHGTQAFLPHLRAADQGHIVNISSVFGMVGIPSQSAYNASKFAVRGFTEALRIELDRDGGTVSCTTVHPGGIKTNIARNGRFSDATVDRFGRSSGELVAAADRIFLTTPEDAARAIVAGIRRDRRRVFIGPDAQAFKLLALLPPGVYQNLIGVALSLGARLAGRAARPGTPAVAEPVGVEVEAAARRAS